MRQRILKRDLISLNFDSLMPNQIVSETDKLVIAKLMLSNNFDKKDLQYAINRFKKAKQNNAKIKDLFPDKFDLIDAAGLDIKKKLSEVFNLFTDSYYKPCIISCCSLLEFMLKNQQGYKGTLDELLTTALSNKLITKSESLKLASFRMDRNELVHDHSNEDLAIDALYLIKLTRSLIRKIYNV